MFAAGDFTSLRSLIIAPISPYYFIVLSPRHEKEKPRYCELRSLAVRGGHDKGRSVATPGPAVIRLGLETSSSGACHSAHQLERSRGDQAQGPHSPVPPVVPARERPREARRLIFERPACRRARRGLWRPRRDSPQHGPSQFSGGHGG